MLRVLRRAVCREPLFRRGRRHRRAQGQRPVAAGAELGAVPGLGKRPLYRSVAALFFGEPVLGFDRHCEEHSDEAIHACSFAFWIASRSLSSGAHSRYPLARNDGYIFLGGPLMSAIDLAASPSGLRALAEQSNAWPFEQAKAIVARLKKKPKDEVLFATGYGPSGLPHIGTFGEVARTTMVRHAFRVLTEDKIRTRLIAFSDDMDGLRKIPDNVPNKEMLEKHLGKPLTRVPDPFGTHDSFGAHNNARLRAVLDAFGFDYEFMSSTACYASGRFDAALMRVLERLEQVMAIMLPSLREERAAPHSPIPPIPPVPRIATHVPLEKIRPAARPVTR